MDFSFAKWIDKKNYTLRVYNYFNFENNVRRLKNEKGPNTNLDPL